MTTSFRMLHLMVGNCDQAHLSIFRLQKSALLAFICVSDLFLDDRFLSERLLEQDHEYKSTNFHQHISLGSVLQYCMRYNPCKYTQDA